MCHDYAKMFCVHLSVMDVGVTSALRFLKLPQLGSLWVVCYKKTAIVHVGACHWIVTVKRAGPE